MRTFVGVDVGGSKTKLVLIDSAGAVLRACEQETLAAAGPEEVVGRIIAHAATFVTACTDAGHEVAALGVAVPGIVDDDAGVALYAANIGWTNVPLRQLLATRLDRPVAMTQDVRAGALAESRLGTAQGYRRSLFVPLGTGLAATLVIDDVPYRGGSHSGGELGHVVVRTDGRVCACGSRGCLETVGSAGAIARIYAELAGGDASAEEVCVRAQAGDAVACEVWNDAVDALATGLLTCMSLLDPDVIVIGGGLALAGDALFLPLRQAVEERATYHVVPPILPASLGAAAGAIGAALRAADVATAALSGP